LGTIKTIPGDEEMEEYNKTPDIEKRKNQKYKRKSNPYRYKYNAFSKEEDWYDSLQTVW
jgi:hypothetical protein